MVDRSDAAPLTLQALLRNEQEAILSEWRTLGNEKIAASRALSDSQQRNNVPELLESIGANAAPVGNNHNVAQLSRQWPSHHAEQRWNMGYTLAEMTQEYGLLRVAVFKRLAPHMNHLSSDELLFLHQSLDDSIVEGVIHYVAKATRHLESEQERLSVTLQSIGDGVISTGTDGKINYLNPAAQDILGWSSAAATGRPVNDVMITLDERSRERLRCAAENALANAHTTHRKTGILLQRANGELFPAEETAAPLNNAHGQCVGAVTTFRDMSTIQALTQRLGYLKAHDVLTGLPNRALLIDRLNQTVAHAERHGRIVGVFFLDIDRFKDINDFFGHAAGDDLLKQVAQRLVSCVQRVDTVCRLGSDEFVILLSEVDERLGIRQMCETIHERIRRPFNQPISDVQLSTSIGISVFPEDGQDANGLLKHAETAMHQAKAEGRNIGKFFAVSMDQRAEERRQLQKELRQAIPAGQLSLHFQPQVLLSSGAAVGTEALVRWCHPRLGDVPPGRFIPVAESQRELMIEIGNWVLEAACNQARDWEDAGYAPLRISVNVSAVQLHSDTLVRRIKSLLQRYQLPANQLQLELTESVLMTDIAGATGQVKALKALGVDISVDDFGTGYSSLSYLQDLPVDELKIDQSFLRGVANNQDKAAIVRAIIQLGQDLDIRVLAEGIEDLQAVEFLAANGCEHAQGFYYSKAIPATAFETEFMFHRSPVISPPASMPPHASL